MIIQVLFVCFGNICRSPAAEGIFRTLIKRHKLADQIRCDSAGTSDCNAGSGPENRMNQAARKRGWKLNSIARAFDPTRDFDKFHQIVTMDNGNYYFLVNSARSDQDSHKITKMTSFITTRNLDEIVDPYAGTLADFESVLDQLEEACANLLIKTRQEWGL